MYNKKGPSATQINPLKRTSFYIIENVIRCNTSHTRISYFFVASDHNLGFRVCLKCGLRPPK